MKKEIRWIIIPIVAFLCLILMIAFGIPSRCFWKIDLGESEGGLGGWGRYDWNDRSSCYASMAVNANNPIICNKVGDINKKVACFYDFVINENNVSFCDFSKDEFARQLCIESFAYNSMNIADCNQLDSFIREKEICVYNTAQATHNISYCTMISDQDYMASCALYLMGHYNLTYDCNEFIEGSKNKEECVSINERINP